MAAFQMVMPTQGELSEQIVEDIHLLNDSFSRFAESRKIDSDAIHRVQIALDEILVNVAAHSGATAVNVQAWLDTAALRVEISDDGTPFNPITDVDPADVTSALEGRELGGLGIHLVRSLMDHVEYAYRGGRNIITLTKQTKEDS
jgi:anti-sigma regulatory factor (Ser/Thr protein kinase)